MAIPFLVVAGGKGLRFGSELPKQYFEVEGKPILWHTLNHLANGGIERVVLVLDLSYKEELQEKVKKIPIQIEYVEGGETRLDSVKQGLTLLSNEDWIGIHDGVRPLISRALIDRLIEASMEPGISGVIPGLPLKDTIKKALGDRVLETLNRDALRRIGTPQLIRLRDYQKALLQVGAFVNQTTDDAGILELAGFRVSIVPGEEEGFKITNQFDLEVLKGLLRRNNENRNRL